MRETAGETTAAACSMCTDGLLHCHGTAVRHEDGDIECLVGCPGEVAVHAFVIDCMELQAGGCLCRRDPDVAAAAS